MEFFAGKRRAWPASRCFGRRRRARLKMADELDASPEQIREAIAAVGPRPADIEMHLKGSRSTSNSDRVHDAGA